jgi:hypothetical protein
MISILGAALGICAFQWLGMWGFFTLVIFLLFVGAAAND